MRRLPPLILLLVSAASADTTWLQLSPASPPARAYAGVSYDPVAGKTVMFGGQATDGTPLGDTWLWDGTSWAVQSPAINPPAVDHVQMVYDGAHSVTLVIGRVSGSTITYTWNGSNWTNKSPATTPTGVLDPALAFDSAHSNVVRFGGSSGSARLDETWVWNGTDWSLKTPAHKPPGRSGGRMVFDPATNQVLLFGGNAGGVNALADTWSWDGTDWTQRSPANSPPARELPSMVYHSALGKVVLFGGVNLGTGTFNDTWTWDGSNWQQLSPASSPSFRYAAGAAYDTNRSVMVMFGGRLGSTNNAETWEFGTPLITMTNGGPYSVANCPVSATFTATASGPVGAFTCTKTFPGGSPSAATSPFNAPVGTTHVACSSTTASASTDISVTDTTAPTLTVPASFTASSTGPTRVTFAVSAGDTCGVTSLSCSPASNTVFPVGKTTVSCSATNIQGTTTTKTFDVTVPVRLILNSNPSNLFTVILSQGNATFTVNGGILSFQAIAGNPVTISTTSPQTITGRKYRFQNWSDGGAISHTFNAPFVATTYTATFSPQYLLTTSATPSTAGVAPVSGNYYDAGTVVPLRATSPAGYSFVGWTGSAVADSHNPNTTITMNADSTVLATFTQGYTTLWFELVNKTGLKNARAWTIRTHANGPAYAYNTQITDFKLTQTAGAPCNPTITTPRSFPATIGTVPQGGVLDTNVTIDFSRCATPAYFNVLAHFSANGGITVGTLSLQSQTP